ncbi:L-arabinose isomerase [Sporolactobacillus shoreicorticis]|uniref:L-arabinose isomerase n=1 Tax=Sporolactobacillus shoreicorticis TaxID=1923877 RepID=A0ABW5S0Q9_9BACL|nr:L-arabinose isomerase [Sporolactobacillus shoreicorticis]MCO7124483.1 L-arabinose isomerase [Sporolactobacillus shoreicorticis]
MLNEKKYEFWFVVGSQHLYGEEALAAVKSNTLKIIDELNVKGNLPYPITFKTVATTADNITQVMKEANYQDDVAGVITWMHTFSPAKNWIRGTKLLQKPLLHLATQFLNTIPWKTIDMDYMNLNQSAHGDREYGYINARLKKNNKVVVGHWKDQKVQKKIANWMDVAVAYNESFNIKVARFGDNMRNVAVTDGDKIEAQIQLGWTVDYYGIGDLVAEMKKVTEEEIEKTYKECQEKYEFVVGDNDPAFFEEHVKEQIREEIALRKFLDRGGYTAFTTNFEDLWGMKQLPGMAVQRLNEEGYGFAGEGDWKTAALDRLIKIMTHNKGTGFMEDYTYDLVNGHEEILGSHMLEVDPTFAQTKPRVEVHPLGIGGKEDPARLVFDGSNGDAVDLTISDFGTEFKFVMYEVDGKAPEEEAPHLPVARQIWTPKSGFYKGVEEWIKNGGGHHTVLTFNASAEQLEDFAKLVGIETVNI